MELTLNGKICSFQHKVYQERDKVQIQHFTNKNKQIKKKSKMHPSNLDDAATTQVTQ